MRSARATFARRGRRYPRQQCRECESLRKIELAGIAESFDADDDVIGWTVKTVTQVGIVGDGFHAAPIRGR